SPPAWNDRPTPFYVAPDTGTEYYDGHPHRVRAFSLAPLFAAVDAMQKPVDWPALDVVASRNALKILLNWIDADAKQNTDGFRMDLTLSGEKTVLISRRERTYWSMPAGHDYGTSFEKASTTLAGDCANSTGYHRIISYDFCGLRMVVRSEVDAYLPNSDALPARDFIQDLPDPHAWVCPRPRAGFFRIIKGGSEVPQSALLELKTSRTHPLRPDLAMRKIPWRHIIPQLVLSATPNLYFAIHDRGTFLSVRKCHEEELAEASRQKSQANLKTNLRLQKLGFMLVQIQELAIQQARGGRQLTLVSKEGTLRAFERRTSMVGLLPEETLARFSAT
ncbi:hypothetical protein OF83DRAFT_1068917, partial [Amylostereum chailletii]